MVVPPVPSEAVVEYIGPPDGTELVVGGLEGEGVGAARAGNMWVGAEGGG